MADRHQDSQLSPERSASPITQETETSEHEEHLLGPHRTASQQRITSAEGSHSPGSTPSAPHSISRKEKSNPANMPKIKTTKTTKTTKKRNCIERTDDGLTFLAISTWTFEMLGVLCGVLSMVALIGILKHYQNKPASDWNFFLHINTVVNILATIGTTTLATPIESGLSQLKWMRFKGSKGGAPLDDLNFLDEASRGTVGRANLLFRGRGGIIASFGALIGILALAFGTFLQQIVELESVSNRTSGNDNVAVIYRAGNISNWQDNGLALRTGFYNGLYGNPQPLSSLGSPANCPTGNCSWTQPFITMAFCSRCEDISDQISYGKANSSNSLPARLVPVPMYNCPDAPNPTVKNLGFPELSLQNGSSTGNSLLQIKSEAIPLGNFSNSENSGPDQSSPQLDPRCQSGNSTEDSLCSNHNVSIPVIRFGILGASQLDNQTNFDAPREGQCPKVSDPWASQCTINLCAQSIMPNVTSGQYNETIIHENLTYTLYPTIDSTGIAIPTGYQACLDEYGYCWNQEYLQNMYDWFHSQDFGGTVNISLRGDTAQDPFISFDTDAITGFWAAVNGSGAAYQNTTDLQTIGMRGIFSRIAKSMTTHLRLSPNAVPIQGNQYNNVVYIRVNWLYMILPIAIVVMTGLFLFSTIFWERKTRTPLWKSSALALLTHGLDEKALERLVVANDDLVEAEKVSEELQVQLLRGEGESHYLALCL